jgi:hypothetical protein
MPLNAGGQVAARLHSEGLLNVASQNDSLGRWLPVYIEQYYLLVRPSLVNIQAQQRPVAVPALPSQKVFAFSIGAMADGDSYSYI